MTREVINEGSTMTVQARMFGRSNEPVTPVTLRYRIKDITNDRVVTDWTVIAPAQTVQVEISARENGVYQDGSRPFQRFEERVVVFQADYDTDSQFAEEIRYLIKNLRGFDS